MPVTRKWSLVSWLLLVSPLIAGCEHLTVRDANSLLVPELMRSEIVGIAAGVGTTFAAVPDLIAMLRRRSAAGMNVRMAAITGVFQILWVYYGLLILSRPVIVWNAIGVCINFVNVAAFLYFSKHSLGSDLES